MRAKSTDPVIISSKITDPKIIVALDFSSAKAALSLAEKLDPRQCRVKVGKELFTRAGPKLVETLVHQDFDVFLDLKFHDIPNTVARACDAAADLGVWMINVHAQGGRRMMEAAREALDKRDVAPMLIAVTILTSLEDKDLSELGLQGTTTEMVLRLADLARQSGMDGVVCSPLEAALLRDMLRDKLVRDEPGATFRLITPGVRPKNVVTGDQKRVMSPSEAINSGADYLVIGRPITAAADPVAALGLILAELDNG